MLFLEGVNMKKKYVGRGTNNFWEQYKLTS